MPSRCSLSAYAQVLERREIKKIKDTRRAQIPFRGQAVHFKTLRSLLVTVVFSRAYKKGYLCESSSEAGFKSPGGLNRSESLQSHVQNNTRLLGSNAQKINAAKWSEGHTVDMRWTEIHFAAHNEWWTAESLQWNKSPALSSRERKEEWRLKSSCILDHLVPVRQLNWLYKFLLINVSLNKLRKY